MDEQSKYEIEFYHVGHATEFKHVFDSKREYDMAKKFLDDLLGPRGVLSEHQSPGASADFYGVDDDQYRAFRDYMRRRR
ncbi:MAG: hypothetical protein IT190_08105 [Microbacteriaceae bacterium]|nr:hypothetical protein [Microbacteriaceae bacterium]